MTDKVQKIREEVEIVVNRRLNLLNGDYFNLNEETDGLTNEIMYIIDPLQEEPVSEELEEAANNFLTEFYGVGEPHNPTDIGFFKAGANWKKEHLWKPADGDDLPDIDREVVVLIKYNAQRNIHDKEYSTYRVGFGHRPNPNGWDGRNILTGEVDHYTPKTYDKGGWNIPDVKWWLDLELPKIEE